MRLLLIDDDKDFVHALRSDLEKEYVVDVSHNGLEGESLILSNEYDVIIIDIWLPDKNGMFICESVRHQGITTPILILTGENDVYKKVYALDIGADDYVTKPFHIPELRARLRTLLRRSSRDNHTNILKLDDLILDLSNRNIERCGKIIHLSRKESALLEYLMRNAGKVVTRDMILNHVWNSEVDPLYNTIDVHIKYLRDRIDRRYEKKLIKTIYGVGYKIEA